MLVRVCTLKVIVALCGVSVFKTQTHGQSLREAIDAMLVEFPRIRAGQTDVKIGQEEIVTAQSFRRPQLGLSLRGGEERFRNAFSNFALAKMGSVSLEASQLLFDGGSARNRIEEARALNRGTQIDLETTRQALALDLSQNYVDILKYRELIRFAEESVRIHQKALDKTLIKFNAGAGPQADVELVKARLSMSEATLEARHRQLSYAVNAYQKYTGTAPGELVEPEFPDWALPLSIEEVDLGSNPRIQSARARITANEVRYKGAKSEFAPKLNLFVQGDTTDSARSINRTEDASALIVMSYDIFGGGRRKAELRKTRSIIDRSIFDLEDTKIEIQASFLNAWNDLVIAEERLYRLEEYRDAMNSVVSAYQRQFELGKRALINVLDVENELFSAKSSVAEERYNRLQAAYRTLAATGSLLETIY